MNRGRREVHDRAHASSYEPVGHHLRVLSRHRDHGDVGPLARGVVFELRHAAHTDAVDHPADELRVVVVNAQHTKTALRKSAITHQRRADLACADDVHLPFAAQTKNLTQLTDELANVVSSTALAERAEEAQVLPHLR